MAYTVHWILHIRILEGVDFPFLRRSSQSRYPTLREDSLPPEPQEKSKDTGVSSLSFLQQIFQPRNPTGFSWIAGRFFTNWAIREVPWKESYNRSRQHIKKQRHHFPENLHIVKLCFSSSHVWMWELDHKEGWVPQNWCFQTMVLQKTLESLLDTKEIKPVNPKGNDPEYLLEGLVLKLNLQYFAHLLWRADLLEETFLDAGNDWRQEEKVMTDEEMVGWHQWLNGHELEQTQGDGEGQENLVRCSPWGHKESDISEQLNNKPKI